MSGSESDASNDLYESIIEDKEKKIILSDVSADTPPPSPKRRKKDKKVKKEESKASSKRKEKKKKVQREEEEEEEDYEDDDKYKLTDDRCKELHKQMMIREEQWKKALGNPIGMKDWVNEIYLFLGDYASKYGICRQDINHLKAYGDQPLVEIRSFLAQLMLCCMHAISRSDSKGTDPLGQMARNIFFMCKMDSVPKHSFSKAFTPDTWKKISYFACQDMKKDKNYMATKELEDFVDIFWMMPKLKGDTIEGALKAPNAFEAMIPIPKVREHTTQCSF